jgi:pimeloyl-ACP methyl ester carboxylesterase
VTTNLCHTSAGGYNLGCPKSPPRFSLTIIEYRTLVMVGDDDEVILEHAAEFYRALPKGEFAVIPGTSHGLMAEKSHLCNQIILDFLMNDPVETFAPIRRATV